MNQKTKTAVIATGAAALVVFNASNFLRAVDAQQANPAAANPSAVQVEKTFTNTTSIFVPKVDTDRVAATVIVSEELADFVIKGVGAGGVYRFEMVRKGEQWTLAARTYPSDAPSANKPYCLPFSCEDGNRVKLELAIDTPNGVVNGTATNLDSGVSVTMPLPGSSRLKAFFGADRMSRPTLVLLGSKSSGGTAPKPECTIAAPIEGEWYSLKDAYTNSHAWEEPKDFLVGGHHRSFPKAQQTE